MTAAKGEGKENGDSNGRVTMAVLSTKIDNVLDMLKDCKWSIDNLDKKIDDIDKRVVKNETKLDSIDTMKKSFIGGLVGLFFTAVTAVWSLVTGK